MFSPETVTSRIDRELGRFRGQKKELRLSVHPSVAAYLLQENAKVKRMLEVERGCTIDCVADEELDQDEYTITPVHKGGAQGQHVL